MARKIHFFDLDDTLFNTYAKINVVDTNTGEIKKKLTNDSYNGYVLQENEKFEFSEFASVEVFKNSKPIESMLNKLKKVQKTDEVYILTARADMDNKDDFLKILNSFGINAGHKRDGKVHIIRSGNLALLNSSLKTEERKLQYVRDIILEKANEKDVEIYLYDDFIKNVTVLEVLADDKKINKQGINLTYKGYKIGNNGSSRRVSYKNNKGHLLNLETIERVKKLELNDYFKHEIEELIKAISYNLIDYAYINILLENIKEKYGEKIKIKVRKIINKNLKAYGFSYYKESLVHYHNDIDYKKKEYIKSLSKEDLNKISFQFLEFLDKLLEDELMLEEKLNVIEYLYAKKKSIFLASTILYEYLTEYLSELKLNFGNEVEILNLEDKIKSERKQYSKKIMGISRYPIEKIDNILYKIVDLNGKKVKFPVNMEDNMIRTFEKTLVSEKDFYKNKVILVNYGNIENFEDLNKGKKCRVVFNIHKDDNSEYYNPYLIPAKYQNISNKEYMDIVYDLPTRENIKDMYVFQSADYLDENIVAVSDGFSELGVPFYKVKGYEADFTRNLEITKVEGQDDLYLIEDKNEEYIEAKNLIELRDKINYKLQLNAYKGFDLNQIKKKLENNKNQEELNYKSK